MQQNHDDYRLIPREPLKPDDALADLRVQRAEQALRHRELLIRTILIFYGVTLAATLALFYLAGFRIMSFGDNVLISLSGVLVGEVGVGAILMQIVKSIFADA